MDSWIQWFVISDIKWKCRPATSGVSQGWTLGLVLINYLNVGTEYTLSKFANDTKLTGNLFRLNKGKYSVLHPGRNNPMQQYILHTDQLESSFAEKDLGVLGGNKLNMSRQHALVWRKAMVSWAARVLMEVILPLYLAPIRCTWNTISRSGLPRMRKTWTYMSNI